MSRGNTSPRGFSLIEILVAVVVSSIGFAAVFALQLSTMKGNVSAREQAAAITLAESGMEQLRAEAYAWTPAQPPAGHLAAAPGPWHLLSDTGVVDQNGLSYVAGNMAGSELSRQRFCVHYWVEPLTNQYVSMMNLRVRVIWPRSPVDDSGLPNFCTEAGAANFRDDVNLWYSVTLPGAVRMRE